MTDRYAVIGNPVEHSLSPEIHAAFARETGQDISYGRLRAPLDGFKSVVAKFRDDGGKGLNVTLPFKQEAHALATKPTIRAAAARAVNTLSFGMNEIGGDNTDGVGLVTDLKVNLSFEPRGRRILLMGAGGAARGVLLPLLLEEPAILTIANRTVAKARQLQDELQEAAASARGKSASGFEVHDYAALRGSRFDLVINATSAGLKDAAPPLPEGVFAPDALAYEMVYGRETPFLRLAAQQGVRAADGLGMLVEQAAESFFIWRGARPSTKPVIDRLRRGRMNVEG